MREWDSLWVIKVWRGRMGDVKGGDDWLERIDGLMRWNDVGIEGRVGDRECDRRRDDLGKNGRKIVLRDCKDVVDGVEFWIDGDVLKKLML